MNEPPNLTEFVAWPQAAVMLGHAVAVRALSNGTLTVYAFNGRRLVRRDAVERLRRTAFLTGRRVGAFKQAGVYKLLH